MKLDFFRNWSIKTRVTLFTLGIFLLSLWLLMFYASRILRTDMQRLLGDQQFSTATFVAEDVNHELEDRLRALEMVAQRLTPALLSNAASLQTALEESTFLLSLFNGGVNVLSLDGVIISTAPPDPARLGVSYMDRDYVVAALKDGKTSFGRPVMGKVLQAPIFSMVAPIRDAQGKVIGALMGVTNLGKPNFLDMIEKATYGKTGGFLLVAPQHRLIITATDKKRIMEELPASGIDSLIDRRVRGQEGTQVFVNPHSVQVLSSAKNVPVTGWFVVVSLPTEEAFAPIRDVERRLLLATLLLTLLAGGVTWWMVQRQLAPMLATVKSLAVMAQSDQHPPLLPVTRQDEIGELVGGFNHLLAELGQRGEALRDSEERFRALVEWSPEAIAVHRDGKLVYVNPATIKMMGAKSAQDLLGKPMLDWVHPDFRQIVLARTQRINDHGVTQPMIEEKFLKVDGTAIDVEVQGTSIIYNGIPATQVAIRDITDRKNAEEKLRQHDNMLFTIVENFPGGISMMDADLRLVIYNQQFKQLLDLPDSWFEKPDLHFEDLIRYNMQRGEYGPGDMEQHAAASIERARRFQPHKFERVRPNGTALEIRGEPLPSGGFVTMYLDITERKQMEDQIRQLAFYDPLTQLPNRRLLGDRLSQALAESKRSGRYGALMFLDLDNFKALNDTLGHAAGDLLLQQAARRMKACVREVDTVARLGGDEFVVMLGDLDTDKAESTLQAGHIAEKIRTALAQPYQLTVKHEGQADAVVGHQCTASIGVVVFIDNEGSQEDFLRWADNAMYRAKDAGSNLIRFSD